MAVLAAREAHHDAVALLDHLVIGDRFADLAAEALRQLAGFIVALALVDADGVDGHARTLDEDGAPAVDRDDLAGHIGRAGQEVYRLRDVLRAADARERRRRDDALALPGIELPVFGPRNRTRRNAVHAHFRRELDRQRARECRQSGLCDAVERIALERTLGVD